MSIGYAQHGDVASIPRYVFQRLYLLKLYSPISVTLLEQVPPTASLVIPAIGTAGMAIMTLDR